MTNYDKIKAMSIDEMVDFLAIYNDRACIRCEDCHMKEHCEYPVTPCDVSARKWLESEVDNNE